MRRNAAIRAVALWWGELSDLLSLEGGKGLEFADDLLAPTVGSQDLRKKGPKRIGFTQYPPATQGARAGGAKILSGNEFAQTLAKLTECLLFELGELGGQDLLG